MEEQILSRKKLESLTNGELEKLADGYGLDIPSSLNRNFIIGELLEYAQELESSAQADKDLNYVEYEDDGEAPGEDCQGLPKSYNETKIYAILRDPAWVYAFWDISEADLQSFSGGGGFQKLRLKASFYDSGESEMHTDSMELNLSLEGRSQYILLPADKRHFALSLEACYEGRPPLTLAKSRRISIPAGSPLLQDAVPGKRLDFPPLIRLSGIDSVLRRHYLDHREMFSE